MLQISGCLSERSSIVEYATQSWARNSHDAIMVLIESIGPGTPRKLPPMTAGAMTTSVHDRHRLDAILSPRASTVPKPPSSWQAAKPRKEDPAPFRSWGWHERNAEAVKLAIQQAVNLALAQQQAAGERAAIRNEELAKASARALEKVKASATKVAAERAAFEARQLELQEQYKERRRKEVQEYLDNQERQKAEKQAMIEQVHALLQRPVPKPKPSPLTLRRLRGTRCRSSNETAIFRRLENDQEEYGGRTSAGCSGGSGQGSRGSMGISNGKEGRKRTEGCSR